MTKGHQCPGCPKVFQSLNDLERHTRKYHRQTLEDMGGAKKFQPQEHERDNTGWACPWVYDYGGGVSRCGLKKGHQGAHSYQYLKDLIEDTADRGP